jgi:hypothetical protein
MLLWACVYLPSNSPDTEAVYLIVICWLIFAFDLVCLAVYVRTFGVALRGSHLITSLLAWQVVILLLMCSFFTMAYPQPEFAIQVVPANLCVVVFSLIPVLMDFCDSTKTESTISLVLMTGGVIIGVCMNTAAFAYDDVPIFSGFEDGNGKRHGAYTKMEINRSGYISLLCLLMGSLKDSLRNPKHDRLYFVRDAVLKPTGGVLGRRSTTLEQITQIIAELELAEPGIELLTDVYDLTEPGPEL